MFKFCFLILLVLALSEARILRHHVRHSIVFNDHHRIVEDNSLPLLLQPSANGSVILLSDISWDGTEKKYKYDYTLPTKVCVQPVETSQSCLVLCPEPEINKKLVRSPGWCSGWLISPNQIVTAGHCMENRSPQDRANEVMNGEDGLLYTQKSRCGITKVMFDFKEQATEATADSGTLHKEMDHVYSCAGLIGKYKNDLAYGITRDRLNNHLNDQPVMDYAVFELDRDVDFNGVAYVHVQAPTNNYYSSSLDGKEVIGVSYPKGFTELYDDTGKINKFYTKNFRATVDATPGSSGSVVTDKATGNAIGMVSMGNSSAVWVENDLADGTKCYKRREIECDGDADQCEKYAPYFTAVNQFYGIKFFDQKPTTLPKLSRQNSVSGGARIKALQKLMGYEEMDGVWDDSLSGAVKGKVKELKIDGVSVLETLLPASYDGSYLTPTVLSMLLCDVTKSYDNNRGGVGGFSMDDKYVETYERKKPCHALGQDGLPTPRGAAEVAYQLFKGHNGYTLSEEDVVSHEGSPDMPNDLMGEKLHDALKSFSEAKGYDNFDDYIPLSMNLWRHLWRTEIDKPSNDP